MHPSGSHRFSNLDPCYWGNIRVMLGVYGDNGKWNGNYYLGFMDISSEFLACKTSNHLSYSMFD